MTTAQEIYDNITDPLTLRKLKMMLEQSQDYEIDYYYVAELACQFNRPSYIHLIYTNFPDETDTDILGGIHRYDVPLQGRAKKLWNIAEAHNSQQVINKFYNMRRLPK